MTLRFLVDTNVLSEPLRAIPDLHVLRKLKEHQDQLATASLVWHELNFGAKKLPRSKRRTLIERYLEHVVSGAMTVLPYDQEAALIHAKWRAKLSMRGVNVPFVDGQIASIAVRNGLTLVTRNVKDFEALDGLNLVNWFEA